MRQVEPPVAALAGTLDPTISTMEVHMPLDHFARCFSKNANTFFQPSSACSMRYIGRS